MSFLTYEFTNMGGRGNNEDYIKTKASQSSALMILADGLGGHSHGEVASKIAVETIAMCFDKNPVMQADDLQDAIVKANAFILKKQQEPGYASIRTTVSALYFDTQKILWAHVGDSRVYHFEDGEPVFVTEDHSVTFRKYKSGLITRDEMHSDEDRTGLLRVLGKSPDIVPDVGGYARQARKGDIFLLCSDGFWEYVYDAEMAIDSLKSDDPEEWVKNMLVRHLHRAEKDCDNLSAIAVFCV